MARLFADTSKVSELKKLIDLGIFEGVTTNPLIVAMEAGDAEPKTYYEKLVREFPDLPISIQLLDEPLENLLAQARAYAAIAPNIVIKVPMFGDGRGVTVLSRLLKEGIKVNVTGLMSAEQLMLTLMTGNAPSYVSLFFNRIKDGGGNPEKEIENARKLIDKLGLPSEIIVGSIRKTEDVREGLMAGGHIITVTPKVIWQMVQHDQSDKFIKQSQEAWEKMISSKPKVNGEAKIHPSKPKPSRERATT